MIAFLAQRLNISSLVEVARIFDQESSGLNKLMTRKLYKVAKTSAADELRRRFIRVMSGCQA